MLLKVNATTWVQVVASILALGQGLWQGLRFAWGKLKHRLRPRPRFLSLGRVAGAVMLGLWITVLFVNGPGVKIVLSSGIVALFVIANVWEYRDYRATKTPMEPLPITLPVEQGEARPVTPRNVAPFVAEGQQILRRPASHRLYEDVVELRLDPPFLAGGVTCEVIDPYGESWETPPKSVSVRGLGLQSELVAVDYPTEFPGAPPLEPGSYAVTWRMQGGFAIMMGRAKEHDSFRWPEGD